MNLRDIRSHVHKDLLPAFRTQLPFRHLLFHANPVKIDAIKYDSPRSIKLETPPSALSCDVVDDDVLPHRIRQRNSVQFFSLSLLERCRRRGCRTALDFIQTSSLGGLSFFLGVDADINLP